MRKNELEDLPVREWVTSGMTNKAIVEKLQHDYGIQATSQAVSMWKRRHRVAPTQNRYDDLLPWVIPQPEAILYMPKLLRLVARMRREDRTLTARDLRKAQAFEARCRDEDLVVVYERGAWVPWRLEAKRPGIDTDIIANPDYPYPRGRR